MAEPRPTGTPSTRDHGTAQVIGLDLGGTKILGGTLGPDGRSIRDIRQATDTRSETHLLDQICAVVQQLSDHRLLAGVSLAVPGVVSPVDGTVSLAPNIPLSPETLLSSVLSERLQTPVWLENDVNVAGLAEAHARSRDRSAGRMLAFLSLGTGVGMALIHRNHIVSGARGQAGEIGYLKVSATDGATPVFLEDLIGSIGIRARHSALAGRPAPDVREIFRKAAEGDSAAVETVIETARICAQGIDAIANMIDPDLIVLGGSIGLNPLFIDALQNATGLRDAVLPGNGPRLAPAHLSDRAGLLGSLTLCCEKTGLPANALYDTEKEFR